MQEKGTEGFEVLVSIFSFVKCTATFSFIVGFDKYD